MSLGASAFKTNPKDPKPYQPQKAHRNTSWPSTPESRYRLSSDKAALSESRPEILPSARPSGGDRIEDSVYFWAEGLTGILFLTEIPQEGGRTQDYRTKWTPKVPIISRSVALPHRKKSRLRSQHGIRQKRLPLALSSPVPRAQNDSPPPGRSLREEASHIRMPAIPVPFRRPI